MLYEAILSKDRARIHAAFEQVKYLESVEPLSPDLDIDRDDLDYQPAITREHMEVFCDYVYGSSLLSTEEDNDQFLLPIKIAKRLFEHTEGLRVLFAEEMLQKFIGRKPDKRSRRETPAKRSRRETPDQILAMYYTKYFAVPLADKLETRPEDLGRFFEILLERVKRDRISTTTESFAQAFSARLTSIVIVAPELCFGLQGFNQAVYFARKYGLMLNVSTNLTRFAKQPREVWEMSNFVYDRKELARTMAYDASTRVKFERFRDFIFKHLDMDKMIDWVFLRILHQGEIAHAEMIGEELVSAFRFAEVFYDRFEVERARRGHLYNIPTERPETMVMEDYVLYHITKKKHGETNPGILDMNYNLRGGRLPSFKDAAKLGNVDVLSWMHWRGHVDPDRDLDVLVVSMYDTEVTKLTMSAEHNRRVSVQYPPSRCSKEMLKTLHQSFKLCLEDEDSKKLIHNHYHWNVAEISLAMDTLHVKTLKMLWEEGVFATSVEADEELALAVFRSARSINDTTKFFEKLEAVEFFGFCHNRKAQFLDILSKVASSSGDGTLYFELRKRTMA